MIVYVWEGWGGGGDSVCVRGVVCDSVCVGEVVCDNVCV